MSILDPADSDIRDLRRIGDRIVTPSSQEELPLSVGLGIGEGSVFIAGDQSLEFKGLSVVNDAPCVLLGEDAGEGRFTMFIEVMPNVMAKTVGGTRVTGDVYVDLDSLWLQKTEITVIDVTETSLGDQIIDNNGKPRMSLGLRFDDTPFIDLSDARGRTRATLEMTEDDEPALHLFDENGTTKFKIN